MVRGDPACVVSLPRAIAPQISEITYSVNGWIRFAIEDGADRLPQITAGGRGRVYLVAISAAAGPQAPYQTSAWATAPVGPKWSGRPSTGRREKIATRATCSGSRDCR